jgi:lipid-binding SYLF domain-containing protein
MDHRSELGGQGDGVTRRAAASGVILGVALAGVAGAAQAANQREITRDGQAALSRLYASRPVMRDYAKRAKGILVFPEIVKAGFVVGGQGGEGVMLVKGQPSGYYSLAAASWGLQAGAQKYSFVQFFMTDKAMTYLKGSKGWAIGTGPSLVMIDEGASAKANQATLKKDIYAIVFGEKGLMAGIDVEGSKITPINPKP